MSIKQKKNRKTGKVSESIALYAGRTKEKKFSFGELFCGPGGLALGAITAKVQYLDDLFSISHSWATDYDKDSCETYRKNICPDDPKSIICRDIRKLDVKELPTIDIG
jgi:DNA (cytosine-5)-methyltransferase 1